MLEIMCSFSDDSVTNNGYFLSQDLTKIVWYFCVIVGEKVGEKVGENVGEKVGEKVGENPRHECGYFDG
jgi:hypothetical protein